MPEHILAMFSSRSFMIPGLKFKSLIHFEFIFVYGVRKWLKFHSFSRCCPVSQHHWLKRLPFSIICSCIFCFRSIAHISMSSCWDCLFCSVTFQVALLVKNPPASAGDMRRGFDPRVRRSSILAPQTEQLEGLQSTGVQRAGRNWTDLTCMHPFCSAVQYVCLLPAPYCFDYSSFVG